MQAPSREKPGLRKGAAHKDFNWPNARLRPVSKPSGERYFKHQGIFTAVDGAWNEIYKTNEQSATSNWTATR